MHATTTPQVNTTKVGQGHRRQASTESILRAARDQKLVNRYKAGDEEAFEVLMMAYDNHIRNTLTNLAGTGDVEDLEQEVFLKIFRNIHQFKGESSFYTWMYRITLNVFFDSNKKRKRADVRLHKMQEEYSDVSIIRHELEDPYTTCLDTLTEETFKAALGKIPKAFGIIVSMREIDDMSYEEISNRIGITPGTVRSRLARGRKYLRSILAPDMKPIIAA